MNKRNLISLLTIFVLFCLGMIGCATSVVAGDIIPPKDWQSFQDDAYKVSMLYPENWVITPTEELPKIESDTANVAFGFNERTKKEGFSSYCNLVVDSSKIYNNLSEIELLRMGKENLEYVKKTSDDSFTVIQEPIVRKIGKRNTLVVAYSYKVTDSLSVYTAQESFEHDGKMYVLTYITDANNVDAATDAQLTMMLTSLKFA